MHCYLVGVKVQFFRILIGQKAYHVPVHKTSYLIHCLVDNATDQQQNIYWPVNNKMGEERMRINRKGPKFIQRVVFFYFSTASIDLVLFSRLTPITGELFTLWHIYYITNSPRETSPVSGPQNILLPLGLSQ